MRLEMEQGRSHAGGGSDEDSRRPWTVPHELLLAERQQGAVV